MRISLARRDPTAFLPLYDRYAQRLERYVLATLGSREDAEDVVSAAFMQAIARIDTFDPERGSFAAWLFTIARNLVRMHHRRGGRGFVGRLSVPMSGGLRRKRHCGGSAPRRSMRPWNGSLRTSAMPSPCAISPNCRLPTLDSNSA